MEKFKKERSRTTITTTSELMDWYRLQAEQKGIAMSAYIAMALNTFRDQQEALKYVKDMPSLVSELQKIAEQIK